MDPLMQGAAPKCSVPGALPFLPWWAPSACIAWAAWALTKTVETDGRHGEPGVSAGVTESLGSVLALEKPVLRWDSEELKQKVSVI